MTNKIKSQNKMMDNSTVEKINEKPVEQTDKSFAFSDGTVVKAKNLGEAQEKHSQIIKKTLKNNK